MGSFEITQIIHLPCLLHTLTSNACRTCFPNTKHQTLNNLPRQRRANTEQQTPNTEQQIERQRNPALRDNKQQIERQRNPALRDNKQQTQNNKHKTTNTKQQTQNNKQQIERSEIPPRGTPNNSPRRRRANNKFNETRVSGTDVRRSTERRWSIQ
jgi:hypothetical protein